MSSMNNTNQGNMETNADQQHWRNKDRLLVWNVRGAESREFLSTLREHIHMQQPHILALLETHINGNRAQEVCNKIGYHGQYRVEAQGFQGSI